MNPLDMSRAKYDIIYLDIILLAISETYNKFKLWRVEYGI